MLRQCIIVIWQLAFKRYSWIRKNITMFLAKNGNALNLRLRHKKFTFEILI